MRGIPSADPSPPVRKSRSAEEYRTSNPTRFARLPHSTPAPATHGCNVWSATNRVALPPMSEPRRTVAPSQCMPVTKKTEPPSPSGPPGAVPQSDVRAKAAVLLDAPRTRPHVSVANAGAFPQVARRAGAAVNADPELTRDVGPAGDERPVADRRPQHAEPALRVVRRRLVARGPHVEADSLGVVGACPVPTGCDSGVRPFLRTRTARTTAPERKPQAASLAARVSDYRTGHSVATNLTFVTPSILTGGATGLPARPVPYASQRAVQAVSPCHRAPRQMPPVPDRLPGWRNSSQMIGAVGEC